ncbi:hypothetical protein [Streptomyces griseorubiginosus]|uniref:hypothetical protein n=1 Tax=Streptomyces griseorubiginosus TaxID=67304 RepID=UPI0036E05539
MEIVAYGVLADEETLLRRAFDRAFAGRHELRCLGMFPDRDTVLTAAGHEAVLSGVNDTLDAQVLRTVTDGRTRMIAHWSTGYSDIDLFAWAPTLPVDRRIVRAAHRTREFDVRLDGLMGRRHREPRLPGPRYGVRPARAAVPRVRPGQLHVPLLPDPSPGVYVGEADRALRRNTGSIRSRAGTRQVRRSYGHATAGHENGDHSGR